LQHEGGLFGERQGWHLPGFNTSSWQSRDLVNGLPNGQPGVGFFVTTFSLNISAGLDVPLSFNFNDGNIRYRALLFVNGWKYGKVCSLALVKSMTMTYLHIPNNPFSSVLETLVHRPNSQSIKVC
jgi:hypothetical protein